MPSLRQADTLQAIPLKAAVVERHPGIVAYAGEQSARRVQVIARQIAMSEARAKADREAAPAQLLAKLRAEGVPLSFERDRITVPSGCTIGARDREMVVVHKAALLKLLAAEAAAARPVVLA